MSKSLLLAVGLLVLPACPLLDVETEVQETCATYHDVQVDGVPVAQGTLSTTFTFSDFGPLQDLTSLNTDLQFTRAELRATTGVSDFAFVQGASLTIASGDPSSTLPSVVVFECAACSTPAPVLDVATSASIDAKDYVTSGSLIVTADFTGRAPAVAWTMDVDVCMSGRGSYSYTP
jgi:hypothetical protein